MSDDMEQREECQQCRQRTNVSTTETMTVIVYPTTGGHFELTIGRMCNVDGLKRAIARKLNVVKDRLCLLHRDRQLQDGTLLENNIQDGHKITLLPMVETGLLAQKPEQCVLQALENLNDSQVNDFLSGKSPLNLTMRLGDHMMFIQLQLSTASSANNNPSTQPQSPSASLRSSSGNPRSTIKQSSSTEDEDGRSTTRMTSTTKDSSNHVTHMLDTRTLAEASRSLSNTLRHLSTQASTPECEHHHVQCSPNNRGKAGAIIESMHHHGKGVYSGTFSGTLNPAMQDRNGHPKRDISTIVHILNDLLGASPQYRRHHHNRQMSPVSGLAMSLARGSPGIRRQSERIATCKSEEEFTQLSQENMATRGKMEQLLLMLNERRSHRRRRREIRWSPYGSQSWSRRITGDGIHGQQQPLIKQVIDEQSQSTCNTNILPVESSVPTTPTKPESSSSSSSSSSSTSTDTAMDCTASSEEYLTPNPVVA